MESGSQTPHYRLPDKSELEHSISEMMREGSRRTAAVGTLAADNQRTVDTLGKTVLTVSCAHIIIEVIHTDIYVIAK